MVKCKTTTLKIAWNEASNSHENELAEAFERLRPYILRSQSYPLIVDNRFLETGYFVMLTCPVHLLVQVMMDCKDWIADWELIEEEGELVT